MATPFLLAEEPSLVAPAAAPASSPRRNNKLQFYGDLVRDFSLNCFTKHTAVLYHDQAVLLYGTNAALRGRMPGGRALVAAAFFLAHKLIDTKHLTCDSMAELAVCSNSEVRNAERILLEDALSILTPPEDVRLALEFERRRIPMALWSRAVRLLDVSIHGARTPTARASPARALHARPSVRLARAQTTRFPRRFE